MLSPFPIRPGPDLPSRTLPTGPVDRPVPGTDRPNTARLLAQARADRTVSIREYSPIRRRQIRRIICTRILGEYSRIRDGYSRYAAAYLRKDLVISAIRLFLKMQKPDTVLALRNRLRKSGRAREEKDKRAKPGQPGRHRFIDPQSLETLRRSPRIKVLRRGFITYRERVSDALRPPVAPMWLPQTVQWALDVGY